MISKMFSATLCFKTKLVRMHAQTHFIELMPRRLKSVTSMSKNTRPEQCHSLLNNKLPLFNINHDDHGCFTPLLFCVESMLPVHVPSEYQVRRHWSSEHTIRCKTLQCSRYSLRHATNGCHKLCSTVPLDRTESSLNILIKFNHYFYIRNPDNYRDSNTRSVVFNLLRDMFT